MKNLYWRPRKVSTTALLLIAVLAVAGMAAVELFPTETVQPYYQEKLAAAHLADRGMKLLREERLRRGHQLDPEIDPTGSGLMGAELTSVTSIGGHLGSKQTTINPNFAAVAVDMLKQAGIKEGDCVAVGYTGSLPALNLTVSAALETLKVRPIIIASALSSQYGANFPDFLWLDMERILRERGYISFHPVAASLGGYEDRALGLSKDLREGIRQTIRRDGLELIEEDTFADSLQARMQTYRRQADRNPIKAYINIGGGTVSIGRALGKKFYQPGLNLKPDERAFRQDSVMTRFAREGIPVIQFAQINELAKEYGLPVTPTRMPQVGKGPIYVTRQYNRWLAGGVLLAILAGLRMFVLTDLGIRFRRLTRRGPPRPHLHVPSRARE